VVLGETRVIDHDNGLFLMKYVEHWK